MAARYFQFNPVQYQSQFDPTPANILQSGLGTRQKRYNQTQDQIAQFQGKIADMPFLDTEARQNFLSHIQGQLNDVYDKYAGDLSAARSDIVGTLNKLRQDPYLNLNRRQLEQSNLFEQARAKEPNRFIGLNDPSKIRLSEVTNPNELNAQYALRSDYTKDISTNFSGLLNRASEVINKRGALSPQYFQQIQQRGLAGLSDEDINSIVSDQDVANFRNRTTFDIDPNLKGTDAKRFIIETLNSITPSQEQSKFIRNLGYVDGNTRARTNKQTESPTLPFTTNYLPGVSKESIDKLDTDLNRFLQSSKRFDNITQLYTDGTTLDKLKALQGVQGTGANTFKNIIHGKVSTPSVLVTVGGLSQVTPQTLRGFLGSDFTKLDKDSSKLNLQQGTLELYQQFFPEDDLLREDKDGNLYIKDAASAGLVGKRVNDLITSDPKQLARQQYEKAIEPFKNNTSYKYLTSIGVDDIEAAKIITDEKRKEYMTHSTGYSPTDPDVSNKIKQDLIRNINKSGKVMMYDEDGTISEEDGNIQDILASGNLENTQLNIIDGTFEIQVSSGKSGEKEVNTYKIPVDDLGNTSVRNSIKHYKSFLDDFYGQNGKLTSNYTLPGGNEGYQINVDYNPQTKSFDRILTHRFTGPNGQVFERPADISEFSSRAVSGIFDNYGKQPTYKTRKR